MSCNINQIKKEFFKTKSRKLKKRTTKQKFITQINLMNKFKYNFFIYFITKNRLLLNRKILIQLLIEEQYINYSFKIWTNLYYKNLY